MRKAVTLDVNAKEITDPVMRRNIQNIYDYLQNVASGTSDTTTDTGSTDEASSTILDSVLPVGSAFMHPGGTLTDYLQFAEGGRILVADYPKLAAAYWNSELSKWKWGGTAAGPSDLDRSKYFLLPDMRGAVPRGWDNKKGLDPDATARTASGTGGVTGNNVGTYQPDAMVDHRHRPVQVGNGAGGGSTGSVQAGGQTNSQTVTTGAEAITTPLVISTETRMKNITWRFVVRVK